MNEAPQLTRYRSSEAGRSPVLIDELPREWFSPSDYLSSAEWPDFSVTSLADWSSSASPRPAVPNDCALVVACTQVIPPIDPPDGWALVIHQVGGIWHEHTRLAVSRLSLGLGGREIIHSIARRMARSNCSAFFASLDQLVEYRNLLNSFGLDCNHHIRGLTEAFYPIDLVPEASLILQITDVPHTFLRPSGAGPVCLAIMAPNCSDW